MQNYRILTVWGIPIRVNISLVVFLPVLAWIIGSGQQIEVYTAIVNAIAPTDIDPAALQSGATPWLIGTAAAVGLFVSVTLHELGHAWAAMRYGLTVDAITLWILGGLASLSQMPKEWNRELTIAIAGPAVSVLTGLACYAVVATVSLGSPVVTFVVGFLAVTNLTLTAFNLLPAFPMDGGRVLRALLARRRPYASATRLAARIGILFALLFALVGILVFSPILLLLALFVYGAATSESRMVALESMLDGFVVRDVFEADKPTIAGSATLADLTERVIDDRVSDHVVVDDAGEVVGIVGLSALRGVPELERNDHTVASVARTDLPRIEVTESAFTALATLDGSSGYAVVTEDGRAVGVLSRADFASLMELTGLARRDRMAQ